MPDCAAWSGGNGVRRPLYIHPASNLQIAVKPVALRPAATRFCGTAWCAIAAAGTWAIDRAIARIVVRPNGAATCQPRATPSLFYTSHRPRLTPRAQVAGLNLRLACGRGSHLLFVCDRCSPQGGSHMPAQGNALGPGTQQRRSPERAQQPWTRNATSIVDESRSPLSSMNGTFRIDRLLRPFRALWCCASQTQGDALVVLHKSPASTYATGASRRPEFTPRLRPRFAPVVRVRSMFAPRGQPHASPGQRPGARNTTT